MLISVLFVVELSPYLPGSPCAEELKSGQVHLVCVCICLLLCFSLFGICVLSDCHCVSVIFACVFFCVDCLSLIAFVCQ